MIPFDTWFLPDGETHLQQWMTTVNRRVEGRLTYQYEKYEAALRFCTRRRCAVDVGAHVGLWSYWMARDFECLDAFEPMPAHRECWVVNMMGRRGNARLHSEALGLHPGEVTLITGPASSGDTRVDPNADTGPVSMTTLDALPLTNVDFIKIDCEGSELFVVQGGEQLIVRNSPVIVVEQKEGHGKRYGVHDRAAVAFLRNRGYVVRDELHGDVILTRGQ